MDGGFLMQMHTLEIHGGTDRSGLPERVASLRVRSGESLAVVGPTGSGKSELLADIEQLAWGDTPSRRRVLLDGEPSRAGGLGLVATLSQRTNFVMDADVESFVRLHAAALGKAVPGQVQAVVDLANSLCGEPIGRQSALQRLSGGQTRALMIADLALISNAPVVLIDEVENAGIDKHRALAALAGGGKIVLTATHDPVLMLMNERRLVMGGGGMRHVLAISEAERGGLAELAAHDTALLTARDCLRQGDRLSGPCGPGDPPCRITPTVSAKEAC